MHLSFVLISFSYVVCCQASGNFFPTVERQVQNIGQTEKIQREIVSPPTRIFNFPILDPSPSDQSQCKTIPSEFGLCYGMEYHRMRLPNLLGHETMKETLQQAKPWPPLVSKGCHPETQKFLCSLYAPVCMKGYEKSIQPCRSLCEAVRDACTPVMAQFSYPWPEMLDCSRFPDADSDQLCIPPRVLTSEPPEPKTCPPCRQKKVAVSIQRKFCSFDFVMRVRVKRLEFDQGRTKITINKRSRKIIRWPSSVRKSKRNALWMQDGLHCTCNVIKSSKARYLVTGWKTQRGLMLHSISRWNRKYKRIVKKMKKSNCRVVS
ncbi:secreted frizzled-related protein 2-like [Clavelina lepadiformis]|uniref:secreted frizzled-related protein 2-like n=1 Tax=Clavelina lepadiformis TaxID=159417 RepID=UPI0040421ED4